MKRIYLLATVLLLLAATEAAYAQGGNTLTILFPGVPTGTCAPFFLGINNLNGALYNCFNGSWIATGGGGGSGTVSAGTINTIAKYTGTTTVGNSAATDDGTTFAYSGTGGISTTGVNGGITGIEGTGAGLTAGAGVDLLYPDSTAHRWKMNNNNGGAFTVAALEGPTFTGVPAAPTAAVNTNTTQLATTAFVMAQSGSPAAPSWMKYFGDGSDGTGPASGALAGDVNMYTTWTCTGSITARGTNRPTIILATGAVNLNAGCVITASDSNATGDIGSTGGGGGGGTAGGTAGSNTLVFVGAVAAGTGTTVGGGGLAGASSGGAAGNGNTPTLVGALNSRKAFLIYPPQGLNIMVAGAKGGAGGSSGGAAGNGGGVIIIIAPSITIASGMYFHAAGVAGSPATANTQGGGGGGGGGVVLLAAQTLTDNGGVFDLQGGPGAGCVNPAVVLSTPAGLTATTTSGIGATARTTTFAGGNPTVITVDNAGSGYDFTPACTIVGTGGGANTGSGATCVVTMAGVSPNQTVSSIAVSGGNAGYGTGTTFTTCGIGGYGGLGWTKKFTIQ